MKKSIYDLNMDYLILAHELINSGQEQEAMVCLGLTPEYVALLYKLPIQKLRELARSDVLRFAPRFTVDRKSTDLIAKYWDIDRSEQHARELRSIVSRQGNRS
jgi:hypothetical protein